MHVLLLNDYVDPCFRTHRHENGVKVSNCNISEIIIQYPSFKCRELLNHAQCDSQYINPIQRIVPPEVRYK